MWLIFIQTIIIYIVIALNPPPSTFLLFLIYFFLQAAKLPMSIIIVGVGQAEFDGKNEDPCASFALQTPVSLKV